MHKFVAPPPQEPNFLKYPNTAHYIRRAAALCVAALVVFFSSCHRSAQSTAEPQAFLTLDSLPEYVDLAYHHDDARACYLVATAIHMQAESGDTLPAIVNLTLYDAQHLLMHAADLGYRPAIETLVSLLDRHALILSEGDTNYYHRLLNE